MKRIYFKHFLTAIALLGSLSLSAQKESVIVNTFDYAESLGQNNAEALRNKVMESISKKGRFNILDAKSNDGAEANYAIDGHLITITCTKTKLESGTMSYDATVTFSLKATDLGKNQMISSETIEAKTGGLTNLTAFTVYHSENEAIAGAMGMIDKKVQAWLDNTFKVGGTVLELDKIKNGKAETLYISLGSDQGFVKGQEFVVKLKSVVAGRERTSEIGRLKLEEVQGGDISLCKVTKGHKEILAAFSETPDKLIVESAAKKKGVFDTLGKVLD